MKKIFLIAFLFTMVNAATAQQTSENKIPAASTEKDHKEHKIVFQMVTGDTLAHKALMKQLNNILTVAPETKLEVVCQGPGLNMLMAEKTLVQDKIQQLKKKNVAFLACEFAMADRNITKEQMIPEAGYVKYGILEIVEKQEKGWSYIKAGF